MRRLVLTALVLGSAASLPAAAAAQAQVFLNINPTWSPTGRQLAFESARHGRIALYVINADGTGERRLTWSTADNTHPAWSPDGSKIAYNALPDSGLVPSADAEARILDLKSGKTTLVARDVDVLTVPRWSPDGGLLFLRRNAGSRQCSSNGVPCRP